MDDWQSTPSSNNIVIIIVIVLVIVGIIILFIAIWNSGKSNTSNTSSQQNNNNAVDDKDDDDNDPIDGASTSSSSKSSQKPVNSSAKISTSTLKPVSHLQIPKVVSKVELPRSEPIKQNSIKNEASVLEISKVELPNIQPHTVEPVSITPAPVVQTSIDAAPVVQTSIDAAPVVPLSMGSAKASVVPLSMGSAQAPQLSQRHINTIDDDARSAELASVEDFDCRQSSGSYVDISSVSEKQNPNFDSCSNVGISSESQKPNSDSYSNVGISSESQKPNSDSCSNVGISSESQKPGSDSYSNVGILSGSEIPKISSESNQDANSIPHISDPVNDGLSKDSIPNVSDLIEEPKIVKDEEEIPSVSPISSVPENVIGLMNSSQNQDRAKGETNTIHLPLLAPLAKITPYVASQIRLPLIASVSNRSQTNSKIDETFGLSIDASMTNPASMSSDFSSLTDKSVRNTRNTRKKSQTNPFRGIADLAKPVGRGRGK